MRFGGGAVMVERRFPASAGSADIGAGSAEVDAANLLGELGDGVALRVGDERVVTFLTAFARKLLAPTVARRFPELASLGFFLRKGEITKALSTLDLTSDTTLRFPRGLVFHVPPANVDTIFVYSWALSALAGNRNVVRVSSRSAGAADAVLTALNAALADVDPATASAISSTQRMITYGHDDEVSTALSAACDLRVIWGGDASVRAIRRYPLAPAARDLTFPDRASFAALSVTGWQAASDAERRDAVTGFYNDSYWFDQAACSSPRTVFWVGEATAAQQARSEFAALLRRLLDDKQHVVEPAMAVQKRVSAYGVAAAGLARQVRFDGNAVATIELVEHADLPREWLGAGTFPQVTIPRLADLADVVLRKDQTLTVFGFDRTEVVELARSLNGRGIDRIVPIGSALTFSAVWDGYDLLHEFTRLTTVSSQLGKA